MALGHLPKIATDGLVLYLDAANKKSYPGSETTWFDLSNNRNGLLTNGSTPGPGYITFDGSNDRVVVNSTNIIYSGGSMEMWLYLNARDRNQGFFSHNQGYPYINFWMPTTNTMRWEVYQSAGVGTAFYSNTVFTTGVWYHVVGTFTQTTTMSLYINGNMDKQVTNLSVQPTSVTAPIYVGDYGAGNYPSSSRIAIAKIYNRTLSATEVFQNFNALRWRFGI